MEVSKSKEYEPIDGNILLTCCRCKIETKAENFPIYRKNKNGRRGYCNECKKGFVRKSWHNNSDKNKEKKKEYYNKNKDKIKERKNRMRSKYNETRRIRTRNKMSNDPFFRFKEAIRSRIKASFDNIDNPKKKRTEEILGCSILEFKIYIESKFESWMNFDNHGLYNGEYNYGWDLDHIIPISSAKTKEDVIRLSHYTNFQPLCSKINRFEKKHNI